jgi:hypothetical protein
MRLGAFPIALLVAALLAADRFAEAETLVDAQALATLEGAAAWPLVDARDLAERSQSPIPGALDPDQAPATAGGVLVIGTDTAGARRVAREIEARLPGSKVVVVDGGVDALRGLRPELANLPSALGITGMPGTFTIPKDTCQPGKPVHTFTDQPGAAPEAPAQTQPQDGGKTGL